MSEDIKNVHVFGMVLEERDGALHLLVPLDGNHRITLFGGSGFEEGARTMLGLLKKELFDESGQTIELLVEPEVSSADGAAHSEGWVPSSYSERGVPEVFYEERYGSGGKSKYGVVYLVPEDAWRRLEGEDERGEDTVTSIRAVKLSDIHERCLVGDATNSTPDMDAFQELVEETLERDLSLDSIKRWKSKDQHNRRSRRSYSAFIRYVVRYAAS